MKEVFFANKEILDLLNKRLSDFRKRYRQNIAIIGREGIGKTFLLRYFLENFFFQNKEIEKERKIVIPLYLQLKKERSFYYFATHFIKTLLFYFLKTKRKFQDDKSPSFDFLIQESRKYLPRTIASIGQIRNYLKDKEDDIAYSLILKLPYILTEEANAKVVIFFDEFHHLDTLKLTLPFSALGKEIVIQKDVLYILVSSTIHVARKILSQKLSLLLGNFELIEMEPFNFRAAQEFLKEENKWLTVSSAHRNFLIALTNGYPLYLKLISKRMRLVAQEERVNHISSHLLKRCLYEEFFSSKGEIYQFLLMKIKDIKSYYLDDFTMILFALVEGGKKIAEISKKAVKKRRDVSKILSRLIERDIVYKNGLFYGLKDSLLRFWLRNAYYPQRVDPSFNLEYAKREFLNKTEELLTNFISESKKDPLKRIEELLGCWKNEVIVIGNKKYKLPYFKTIRFEQVSFQSSGHPSEVFLIGEEKNKFCVGALKKRDVHQKTVIDFIDKCKKISTKYKIRRKILIALKKVEVDAKILAKEEKIWLWGLKEINFLLDFYAKPKIIIN